MKALDLYEKLKKQAKSNISDDKTGQLIMDIYNDCETFLSTASVQPLKSMVAGKEYFAFTMKDKISRPINKDLFVPDGTLAGSIMETIRTGDYKTIKPPALNNGIYTLAMAFNATCDLLKTSDQKTPATFFECLIGHIFSKRIGTTPRKQVDVLNMDMKTTLPTDFIFDLGVGRSKFHLPVKTSTRERVVQVWAHQRVLDGVYGVGRFLGILVCLTETKLDRKKLEVIEICLPDQWRVYQLFIAQMTRVYYLDVPRAYICLNNVFPKITVKPLGEFFFEADKLSE